MFQAIAFAGGGNRCYWQGGFWAAAAPRLGLAPALVVGVSAGAWAACCSLLGCGRRVNDLVVEGCSRGIPNVVWSRGRPSFPVAGMYEEMLRLVLDEAALARLKAGPDLRIAVARKPRRLPLALAIPLGIAAYQVEKHLTAPVHPRGGRWLGFEPHYVPVRDLTSPGELVAALMASASVPPFMPVGQVAGLAALDGGLVDNVPVDPLRPVEARGERTLVLLTRRYRALPRIPGRTYVQPSAPVPIGQFDITRPEGIRRAFDLGLRDGEAFAREVLSGRGACT